MSRRLVMFAAFALLVAAGSGARSDTGNATTAIPRNYAMPATTRCLVRKGAKVGPVPRTNARLRSLHDLAQRNSIQAKIAGHTVGVAFTKSVSAAGLLAELLAVPKDPYHVVLRRNALLMFRPADRPAFDAAVACLRS